MKNRLLLVLGIVVFGFAVVYTLVTGSIRVGRVHGVEIRKEESPAQYWFYTGVLVTLTSVGLIQLYRQLSHASKKVPIQSPVPTRGNGT